MDEDLKHIGRYIGRLHNLMRRRLWKNKSNLNCSGAEMKILSHILVQEKPILQKDIENEFLLRPSTATEILKKLEQQGLIKRIQEEDDARKKRIILTEKVINEEKNLIGSILEFERDLTKGISRNDLSTFCRIADKMQENLLSSAEKDNLEEEL